MEFKIINPYTGKLYDTIKGHNREEVENMLKKADEAFEILRKTEIDERAKLMHKVGDVLIENLEIYSNTISIEMGKPITESKAEIEKCAWLCDYYAENAEIFLADEIIETEADESFISYDPIGAVLAVMPWNYPFWQVFRFAVPALMAGNVGLLKHASNTPQSALYIQEIFEKAGFPKGAFQSLLVHRNDIEWLIESDTVKAVTLTGSEIAGKSVASIAGKNIKKTVLELGGSNAFMVWDDVDVDKTVDLAVKARYQNDGQSCIAAKRFIVHEKVYDEFVNKFVKKVSELKTGDPLDPQTNIGTMAREDLAKELYVQVQSSLKKGAKLLLGGDYKGAFMEPTVLADVEPGMSVFDEETFGPVAAISKVKSREESIEYSNKSVFGLGATICTKDIDDALSYVGEITDGALFINELVKSDPRLPFGGTKISGYGRELSQEGIREFVNIKTVYVKK